MHLLDRNRISILATELSQAAHQARDAQAELRLNARQLTWHSTAATAFESALTALLRQFTRLDSRLDQLAATVSAHGRDAGRRAEAAATMVAESASSAARAITRLTKLP